MNFDLTVAIPTYNGEKRLPEVLERLQSCWQQAMLVASPSEQFSWEVIVVDNNSTDNTADLVKTYQKSWPQQCPLRYCFEPRQGAAFARHRAFTEARGKLVGFLDDDNLPAADWVRAAYVFAQEHPCAGAYGSQIHGLFEVTPPDNFERIAPFLAITERGYQPLYYQPNRKLLPPSAGLVVRKQAWLESVPNQQILTGRTHNHIVTGEDLEMLSYIQAYGWEIWYNPAMEIDHKIPYWRLEKYYLLNLVRGIGLSRHVTRMLGFKTWQRPLAFAAYLINDLRKIALHLLKYRQQVKTDLVAACELELFLSSLSSPFYLWIKGYYQ
ncbi:MAG: glycosyltransferase family 2 protein [Merismopedia sp. SIO2A8]|nr:glycosyltransferase family 2 protein [Symploca sp. SIO2B6]NET50779.1 glycosyltransferase family 2 protein [Merismopedia sp. SIO2A8]